MATVPRMASPSLPSAQRQGLLRSVLGGVNSAIPPAEQPSKDQRQEPIGVSINDDITGLIRKFPGLKPVLQPYRNHREKRIRDLQIAGPERNHLLYQILAIKKAGKRKSSLKRYDQLRARRQ
ncbi:MAG: hypothetical protein ACE5MH_04235 [Terriglobia bacterium]